MRRLPLYGMRSLVAAYGSVAYGRQRGADIAAHDVRVAAGDAARRVAIAVDAAERASDPAYQRAARLVFPVSTPCLDDGRPWVGPVAERHRQLQAEQARSRARSTVKGYAAPLRRALDWMRAEWQRQATATPFSAQAVAAHGGVLASSYLRHLADTTTARDVSAAVASASTAINRWLGARRQPPVANAALPSALRERLRREEGVARRQTPGLAAGEARAIWMNWGFHGFRSYMRWTALAAALGVAVLGRFDTLSWITVTGLEFQYVDGIRLVSVCLTKAKNSQTGSPLWLDIPAVPGDSHSLYWLMVEVLRAELRIRVPLRQRVFRPAVSDGLGLLFPAWGASRQNHRHRFDPPMDRTRRASTAAYRRQLVNAVEEVLRVPRQQAQRFGMSSLRSGGDTHLRRLQIPQWERCELGRWATPGVEDGYDRRAAVEHARDLLQRGVAI